MIKPQLASELRNRFSRCFDETQAASGELSQSCAALSRAVPLDLSILDGRRVAISFSSRGRKHMLPGEAFYDCDPDLGGVLRVAVQDESGPLEFLFVEGEWNGTIEPGAKNGCEYVLHVG